MILLSYISPEGVFNLNMVEDRFLDMKDLLQHEKINDLATMTVWWKEFFERPNINS